ncbi:hypothetical protein G7062_07470 [Erysipelothrix sp. HDW6C]|uniref:hypothetical protein n=1 Tax=Erysipelothrix sp. HDW6C TaxID=2714930 RepID=UPI00140C42D9|nr:hypothetical protein [Erysipelothrix sp. HDW6C]QIK70135.1 hypothetical protein G7062_07470 [Erysipelothrix sp. HDW6C]
MKRVIALTRVILKSSQDQIFNTGKSKKKRNSLLTKIGFGFLFVYLGGIVMFISYAMVQALVNIGQPGLGIQLVFTGINMYLFLMGILIIPTIFYFAKDVERYLVMPLKPWEIMTAKFLASLMSMYMTMAIITIPFGISYFLVAKPGFLFIPLYLIANVFLPLLPLIITVAFTILLFTFIPFFKNKDVFTYVSAAIGIAIGLGFAFLGQSFGPETGDFFTSILSSLESGDNAIVNVLNTIFPSGDQLARGIVYHDFVAFLIGIVISVGSAAIGIFLTQGLYFKGVIGIGEGNAKKRRLSNSETYSRSTSKKPLMAIMEYDFKNIMRTPVFAMNYFVMIVIMPVIMFLPLLMSGGMTSIVGAMPEIRSFLDAIPLEYYLMGAVFGGFFFAFALSAFGTMTSTALSREGRALLQFTVMPIGLDTIVKAKILLGAICMSVVPILFGIVITIMFRLNILYLVLYIIAALVGALCENVLAIVSDVYAPKLDWEDEQQAIKQNFLAVVPMFAVMGIGIGIGFFAFKVGPALGLPIAMVLLIVVAIVLYRVCLKVATTRLSLKLEEL